jgi:hypothetical protein
MGGISQIRGQNLPASPTNSMNSVVTDFLIRIGDLRIAILITVSPTASRGVTLKIATIQDETLIRDETSIQDETMIRDETTILEGTITPEETTNRITTKMILTIFRSKPITGATTIGSKMTAPSRQRNEFSKPKGRNLYRGISNDEEDGSGRIDFKQMQRDYDLDEQDLPEEPRQSSRIRFSNADNQAAIKDAYLRRFKVDSGSKREFHTHAALSNLQRVRSQDELLSGSFMKDTHNNKEGGKYSKKAFTSQRNSEEDKNLQSKIQDTVLDADDDPEVFGSLSKIKSKSLPSLKDSELAKEASSPENVYAEEEEDDVIFRPEARMSMRKLTAQTQDLLKQKKVSYDMNECHH